MVLCYLSLVEQRSVETKNPFVILEEQLLVCHFDTWAIFFLRTQKYASMVDMLKKGLRQEMRKQLLSMSQASVQYESERITQHLLNWNVYTQAKNVSVFITKKEGNLNIN